MKVALVQTGLAQLQDGHLSPGDKASIVEMSALVLAQQQRVAALQ
jgi:hypothetical protein